MSVIKPEMMQNIITRYDLLPLSFLRLSAYTGSKRKLNYRLEKYKPGDAEEELLRCSSWTSPLCFEKTPSEEISVRDFPFTDEGIDQAAEHLNGILADIEKETGK